MLLGAARRVFLGRRVPVGAAAFYSPLLRPQPLVAVRSVKLGQIILPNSRSLQISGTGSPVVSAASTINGNAWRSPLGSRYFSAGSKDGDDAPSGPAAPAASAGVPTAEPTPTAPAVTTGFGGGDIPSPDSQDRIIKFFLDAPRLIGVQVFIRVLSQLRTFVQTTHGEATRINLTKRIKNLIDKKAPEHSDHVVELLVAALPDLTQYRVECVLHFVKQSKWDGDDTTHYAKVVEQAIMNTLKPPSEYVPDFQLDMFKLPPHEPTPYRVWVDNLPSDLTERDVMHHFRNLGEVVRVDLARGLEIITPYSSARRKDDRRGRRSKKRKNTTSVDAKAKMSAGLLYFTNQESVDRALAESCRLFGVVIHKSLCPTRPAEEMVDLLLTGLPANTNESQIREILGLQKSSGVVQVSMVTGRQSVATSFTSEAVNLDTAWDDAEGEMGDLFVDLCMDQSKRPVNSDFDEPMIGCSIRFETPEQAIRVYEKVKSLRAAWVHFDGSPEAAKKRKSKKRDDEDDEDMQPIHAAIKRKHDRVTEVQGHRFSVPEYTSASIPMFRHRVNRRTGGPRLLSPIMVQELKRVLSENEADNEFFDHKKTLSEMAKSFDVSLSTISDIKFGRTWKYVDTDGQKDTKPKPQTKVRIIRNHTSKSEPPVPKPKGKKKKNSDV